MDSLERSSLLNKSDASRKNVSPFSVTYSPTLANIRERINKQWDILNIHNTFRNVFETTPVVAFRKTLGEHKSLAQIQSEKTKNFSGLSKLKENAFHVIHHDVFYANT